MDKIKNDGRSPMNAEVNHFLVRNGQGMNIRLLPPYPGKTCGRKKDGSTLASAAAKCMPGKVSQWPWQTSPLLLFLIPMRKQVGSGRRAQQSQWASRFKRFCRNVAFAKLTSSGHWQYTVAMVDECSPSASRNAVYGK